MSDDCLFLRVLESENPKLKGLHSHMAFLPFRLLNVLTGSICLLSLLESGQVGLTSLFKVGSSPFAEHCHVVILGNLVA